MTYSLLLYGPHSYTYIALITFIRLSLLEHLVRACTGASSYKPYLVTAYKPVVTSLSRYRTESPSLPVVTQQSCLVTGFSLQPYMAVVTDPVVTSRYLIRALSLPAQAATHSYTQLSLPVLPSLQDPSLSVVTQQSFLVTGSSLQPYMAPPYRSVVTASLQAISLQVGPRYSSLHNRVVSLPDCSLPLISPSLPLADRRYTLYGCRYG